MKLLDFTTKWRTDTKSKNKINIITPDGNTHEVEMEALVNVAPLGDLLGEYIFHVNQSRWKRDCDWDYVKRRMEAVLNQIYIEWAQ